ncbi:unnamed protein product, partial [Pelagomonas calceolata]
SVHNLTIAAPEHESLAGVASTIPSPRRARRRRGPPVAARPADAQQVGAQPREVGPRQVVHVSLALEARRPREVVQHGVAPPFDRRPRRLRERRRRQGRHDARALADRRRQQRLVADRRPLHRAAVRRDGRSDAGAPRAQAPRRPRPVGEEDAAVVRLAQQPRPVVRVGRDGGLVVGRERRRGVPERGERRGDERPDWGPRDDVHVDVPHDVLANHVQQPHLQLLVEDRRALLAARLDAHRHLRGRSRWLRGASATLQAEETAPFRADRRHGRRRRRARRPVRERVYRAREGARPPKAPDAHAEQRFSRQPAAGDHRNGDAGLRSCRRGRAHDGRREEAHPAALRGCPGQAAVAARGAAVA